MHAVVLRYLDQVARVGSIRRAAEKLNVASSAVNRQILKLEKEIGAPIFERVGNGVRLTPAGEQLLRHTRNTLAEWRRTRLEIAAIAGDIRGEVRITAIPSLLVSATPRAMTAVASRYPNISFRVIDADPAEHVEEMRAARADIALTFIDKRHRHYEVAGRLSASLGAILRPDHPLAERRARAHSKCGCGPTRDGAGRRGRGEAWAVEVGVE